LPQHKKTARIFTSPGGLVKTNRVRGKLRPVKLTADGYILKLNKPIKSVMAGWLAGMYAPFEPTTGLGKLSRLR
jgi:hypothetical protein